MEARIATLRMILGISKIAMTVLSKTWNSVTIARRVKTRSWLSYDDENWDIGTWARRHNHQCGDFKKVKNSIGFVSSTSRRRSDVVLYEFAEELHELLSLVRSS